MIAGCLIVPVATKVEHYALVLVALFVIAGGITVLQVAANPLAAALGTPERSHLRLTLSQAFNSLGTVIGPYLGSRLMLHGGCSLLPEELPSLPRSVRSRCGTSIDRFLACGADRRSGCVCLELSTPL